MNIGRMIALADLLDSLERERFYMPYWFSTIDNRFSKPLNNMFQVMNGYDCNSAACIAGWTVAMKYDFVLNRPDEATVNFDASDPEDTLPILKEAAEYLGLTESEAANLFVSNKSSPWITYFHEFGFDFDLLDRVICGEGDDISIMEAITPQMAANMIRNIVSGKWELSSVVDKEDFWDNHFGLTSVSGDDCP